MNINNLISELKRRNVFKVATAYAIAGWLIIQISDIVFPRLGLPDWTITFIIAIVGIGFPIALIVAWAFELTPDGVQKSNEVEITESVTATTGKKLNGIIIGVLSVAVFFLVIERVFFAEASILEEAGTALNIENASIAVLPFVNMSSDKENEYFSDGLSEELLNGLAKIEGMQVAGRTSSFSFKGKNENLKLVAEELGVKHILEGSVRKDGNTIRITAQLIQADNGFHLWSETYDREIESIFAIQEEITRKVVQELKVRLLPQEEIQLTERPTKDIEAYNAYLEATQLEVNRVAADIEKAIKKYEEAVRIDPTFSLAYARLAYTYGLLYNYGDLQVDEARYLVRRNIEQALILDKNQGKAYQAQALYYVDLDRDLDMALEAGKKAVELLPNDPLAWNMLSVVYEYREEYENQDSIAVKSYQLDPLSPTIAGNWAQILIDDEKSDEALLLLDRILERNPDYMTAINRKVNVLNSSPFGELDTAFEVLYDNHQQKPDNYFLLDALYHQALMLDMLPIARHFNDKLLLLYPNNRHVISHLTQLYIFNKEYDKAEEYIESLADQYGEDIKRDYLRAISQIYHIKGRNQEIQLHVEKFYPQLLEEEPEMDNTFDGLSINYSWILDENGFPERAKKIRALALESIKSEINKDREKGLQIATMNGDAWIAEIEGDLEKTFALRNTLYFEKKDKGGGVLRFNGNPRNEDRFSNYQPYLDLKEKVTVDVHEMRANVIEYLKTEGEWKEEWEVKEN